MSDALDAILEETRRKRDRRLDRALALYHEGFVAFLRCWTLMHGLPTVLLYAGWISFFAPARSFDNRFCEACMGIPFWFASAYLVWRIIPGFVEWCRNEPVNTPLEREAWAVITIGLTFTLACFVTFFFIYVQKEGGHSLACFSCLLKVAGTVVSLWGMSLFMRARWRDRVWRALPRWHFHVSLWLFVLPALFSSLAAWPFEYLLIRNSHLTFSVADMMK